MAEAAEKDLRAVIVEDDPLAREALRGCLSDDAIEVVAVAHDGTSGVAAVEQFLPDVALVDLNLPDISGAEVTARICTAAPSTKVLIVTASTNQSDVAEAFRAGATGYLLKSADRKGIAAATRATAQGDPIVSETIASLLIEVVRETEKKPISDVEAFPSLTEREVQILKLIARGQSNVEIARALYLSPHTVKHHVANILGKLHIHTRLEAAVEAVRAGMA